MAKKVDLKSFSPLSFLSEISPWMRFKNPMLSYLRSKVKLQFKWHRSGRRLELTASQNIRDQCQISNAGTILLNARIIGACPRKSFAEIKKRSLILKRGVSRKQ